MDSGNKRTSVALLMIDSDNSEAINDQNGHSVGDQVLSTVARRINSTLRQDDLAGRYGGDEIVILTPELGRPGSILQLEDLVHQADGALLQARKNRRNRIVNSVLP